MALVQLPEDVLVRILECVDGRALGSVAQVCRVLRVLLEREASPWRAAIVRALLPAGASWRVASESVPFSSLARDTGMQAARWRRAYVRLYCRRADPPRCACCLQTTPRRPRVDIRAHHARPAETAAAADKTTARDAAWLRRRVRSEAAQLSICSMLMATHAARAAARAAP